jgi:hypothetical protein
MLDDVAGMRDHARTQQLAVWDLHCLEQMVFVFVARIRRLETEGASIDFQHVRDDVTERRLVEAGSLINA